ncbi:hypothetical protein V6N11_072724 [Hibiscus sabdariffa]|uniref:F-box domain-containing protein n=2 Tax=Hibiscus sabdariffa TaxID=183260 RepID=A0ABR2NE00_9ROSI
MAKQAKYEGLLDSLPDSIICHILSFLPTRDAVRTSVLSPMWRHLFTLSISKLDVNDCLPEPEVSAEGIESFKKFMDRLFFSPQPQRRLECFRMHDLWMVDDDYLSFYNWLSAALRSGVKEFDVDLFDADIRQISNLLFTCSSLVTLKLDIGGDVTAYRASNDFDWLIVTNAPSLVYFKYFCFVNMESLERADITIFHLKDVDCDRSATLLRESAMYRFYICPFMIMMHSSSGCILIRGLPFTILLNWNLRIIVTIAKDLGLFGCFGSSELNIHGLSLKRLVLDFQNLVYKNDFDWLIVIDAPSLVYFEYFCPVGRGYALRNMESLEKADITIFNFNDVDRERSAALLEGICSVQVLHLSIVDDDAPLLRTPLDPVLAFNNLVELQCKNPPDFSNISVTWIVEFLHRTPNLKTLILFVISPQ